LRPRETAQLELASDGTVAVYVGSAAVGQGLETVMAQIAADTLGIPLGRVRVFHGSTSYLQEGYGAFHSRSTILGGSAVFEGARALLETMRAAAAARLGGSAEEIELVDERARISDGRSVFFAELAEIAGRLMVMARSPKPPPAEPVEIHDEPGMADRFQRALRKALNTPPKHRTSPTPQTKERPASKGRVHKGKTRN
jgi:CO/xanthine dehydrogenase Mo-binding subunit